MKTLTLPIDSDLFVRLSQMAEIRHQSVEDAALGLLRGSLGTDLPSIDAGGFTEIARGKDLRKNWFWDALNDE